MISNPSILRVHYLERIPLQTPYPIQAERIIWLKRQLPRDAGLVIDCTGVGVAVADEIERRGVFPTRVAIVHGQDANWHGSNRVSLPKGVLVSKIVARIHAEELRVHHSIKDWPTLRRELMNFHTELTRGGSETWNAARSEHDDLVIATSLACWYLSDGAVPWQGLLSYLTQSRGLSRPERWCLGVDVGQAHDPSALCVMSRIDGPAPTDLHDMNFQQEVTERGV
jgi:hypothetical protein